MAIVLDTSRIVSRNLNTRVFGQFKHEGLNLPNIDRGLLKSLRACNQEPTETKNLSFNFDMICLNNGPLPPDVTALPNGTFTPGHDVENYEQVFKIYDDVQVMGFMLDVWGFDRPGLQSNGIASTGLGQQSNAMCVRVKILGNYTVLDDELGYPAIYKSTEFNLVEDFDLLLEDKQGFLPNNAPVLSQWDLGRNYLSNGSYEDTNSVTKQVPGRQLFYPLDPEKVLMMLHGGSSYIISISPFIDDGSVGQSETGVYAYHMITSLQITLVCQSNRRKWA